MTKHPSFKQISIKYAQKIGLVLLYMLTAFWVGNLTARLLYQVLYSNKYQMVMNHPVDVMGVFTNALDKKNVDIIMLMDDGTEKTLTVPEKELETGEWKAKACKEFFNGGKCKELKSK